MTSLLFRTRAWEWDSWVLVRVEIEEDDDDNDALEVLDAVLTTAFGTASSLHVQRQAADGEWEELE